MTTGRSIKLGLLFLFVFPLLAKADENYFSLLKCAAEFNARAEYNRGLELTNSVYQKFLWDRSDLFLRMAEQRAPLQPMACKNNAWSRYTDLVLCTGPASLSSELRKLTQMRLTEIVGATGGTGNFSTCMEDEPCIICQQMLKRAANLDKQ